MHRQILYLYSFLLIFAVFATLKADVGSSVKPVITYTCTAGKITTINVVGVSYDNMKVVSESGKYCIRSQNGKAGLLACIGKHKSTNKVQLIYEGETNAQLDAGKSVLHYGLSCDEKSEIKNATMELKNKFGATDAPKWTTLNANLQSGDPELTIDPKQDLHVGQKLTLAMKISGTNHAKYSLSPRECYAHRKGDLDSIKIWECIDTVVDPNIIDQSVWKSDTEVTDATSVSIPMYAFKFVDSEDLFIECSAMVCVNPSSQCTLDTCASTTTTTTFSPTGARKRRGVHTSNDKINITIRHASVSLEVKDLSFNKSSGLASTWYAYLVPAYFVICARLYL